MNRNTEDEDTYKIASMALSHMGGEPVEEEDDDRRDKWEKRPVASALNALGGGFLGAANRRSP